MPHSDELLTSENFVCQHLCRVEDVLDLPVISYAPHGASFISHRTKSTLAVSASRLNETTDFDHRIGSHAVKKVRQCSA